MTENLRVIFTVEDGKLVKYNRHGTCNRCGECCGVKNTITYRMKVFCSSEDKNEDGTTATWDEWEGYSMLFSQGIWWYFKILDIIPFEEDPETQNHCNCLETETNLCKIFNDPEEFRPVCRYWPFHPSNLETFKNCSFTFEKVEEIENESKTD